MNGITASESPPQPPRVQPTLGRTWGGIWRLTWARFASRQHGLTLLGLLAGLGLICGLFLNGRHGRAHYVDWTIGFYFAFLVPLSAFITTAGAMRDEMKPTNVDYVLLRPVRRPVFVALKYAAHVLTAQSDYLLGFAVLAGLGWWWRVPDFSTAMPALLLAQILLVFAFSGFGFLCGAITAKYAILGLAYGAIVEVGLGQIPTQLSRLSMTHEIKAMLQPYIGASDSAYAVALRALAPATKLGTTGVLLTFAAVTVVLAALIFSLRELSGQNEP